MKKIERKKTCLQPRWKTVCRSSHCICPSRKVIYNWKKENKKQDISMFKNSWIYILQMLTKKEILLLPYQVSTNKQKHKQWINLNMIFLQVKNKLCGKGWLKQWFDFKNICGEKRRKEKSKIKIQSINHQKVPRKKKVCIFLKLSCFLILSSVSTPRRDEVDSTRLFFKNSEGKNVPGFATHCMAEHHANPHSKIRYHARLSLTRVCVITFWVV